jgi:hypothetical protein
MHAQTVARNWRPGISKDGPIASAPVPCCACGSRAQPRMYRPMLASTLYCVASNSLSATSARLLKSSNQ